MGTQAGSQISSAERDVAQGLAATTGDGAPATPFYIVDEGLLSRNLETLSRVAYESGAKILLAQKSFSMFAVYPLIARYLDGAAASSLNEARLSAEELKKETHIYAPAYREDEFSEITRYASHIIFNSFSQWRRFRTEVNAQNDLMNTTVECGIRINPEYSEIETEIYNPCAPFSRFGVRAGDFEREALSGGLDGIFGIHFHTLCEQNSDALKRTLTIIRKKFGRFIHGLKWVNFGGGHHITRRDYDIETLIACIREFGDEYGVDIYLEPGEAIALNTGFLVASVLDIAENGMNIAIIDASAACHMPDTLEMPYRAHVAGSADPSLRGFSRNEYPYIYRIGGPTCLAGDTVGDYAFKEPLLPGCRIVFTDMAHYTMVKNNTFNGVSLPSIAIKTKNDGKIKIVRSFGYKDFKTRLS